MSHPPPLRHKPQEPASPAEVRQRLRQGLASGEGRQQGKHAQGELVRVMARPLLVAAGQAGGVGRRWQAVSSAADCCTCRLRNATQAAATAVLVQPAASKSRPVAPRSAGGVVPKGVVVPKRRRSACTHLRRRKAVSSAFRRSRTPSTLAARSLRSITVISAHQERAVASAVFCFESEQIGIRLSTAGTAPSPSFLRIK